MAKSARTEFDEFVRREQAIVGSAKDATVKTVDWDKERDDWLRHLDDLYSKIQSFLKSYVDNGHISFDFKDLSINEENIGIYHARRMTIHIGSHDITLTPIGTLLIGSKGRVDVEGSAGRARLVLVTRTTTSFSDMFQVTVEIVDGPHYVPSAKQIPANNQPLSWDWKIVTSPPVMGFVELNAESFQQMLLEVTNA